MLRREAALRSKESLERARLAELERVRGELDFEEADSKAGAGSNGDRVENGKTQGGETEEERLHRHTEVKRRADLAR